VLVDEDTVWTPTDQLAAPSMNGKYLVKNMDLNVHASLDIGIPHTIYGQLIDSDGKTPVPEKQIFVTVKRENQISQELACTTDALGYFNLDLGNLRTSIGTVFKYQIGDEIYLEAPGIERQQTQVINETIQDVGKLFIQNIPKTMSLGQNYPNPFNPDTWIPYQLTKPSDVTISIYNSAGKLVRSFLLTGKPAGDYISREKALHWNGRNEEGEQVASGIYFYKLTAGSFVAVKKMAIIR
jgi:hypothetical protein